MFEYPWNDRISTKYSQFMWISYLIYILKEQVASGNQIWPSGCWFSDFTFKRNDFMWFLGAIFVVLLLQQAWNVHPQAFPTGINTIEPVLLDSTAANNIRKRCRKLRLVMLKILCNRLKLEFSHVTCQKTPNFRIFLGGPWSTEHNLLLVWSCNGQVFFPSKDKLYPDASPHIAQAMGHLLGLEQLVTCTNSQVMMCTVFLTISWDPMDKDSLSTLKLTALKKIPEIWPHREMQLGPWRSWHAHDISLS